MKKLWMIGFLLAGLYGCHTAKEKGNAEYLAIPNQSCEKIEWDAPLTLDTLILDGKQSSMEGQFFILRDTLYLADEAVGGILAFDKEGKYIGVKIRKGNGPNEVTGVHAASIFGEGCATLDKQWVVSVFDRSWNKIYNFRIAWYPKHKPEEQLHNPDPEDSGIYEVEYYKNIIHSYGEKYLLIHITSEHINFNAFQGSNTRLFYDQAYSIGMLSLDSGRIEKMLCHYSPVYANYNYLPTFKNQLFDTDNRELVYSFEADSLLYRYDIEQSKRLSFGKQGKGMNTTYPEYQNVDDMEKNYHQDRKQYGYYRYLKVIGQEGITFRGYRKGAEPLSDGLQIYRGNCLVADVEVPREFEVIGYIAPWYYAYGNSDFDQETMTCYRFKIP